MSDDDRVPPADQLDSNDPQRGDDHPIDQLATALEALSSGNDSGEGAHPADPVAEHAVEIDSAPLGPAQVAAEADGTVPARDPISRRRTTTDTTADDAEDAGAA